MAVLFSLIFESKMSEMREGGVEREGRKAEELGGMDADDDGILDP